MAYEISGNEIFARARVIATQTGTDANLSAVIDGKGGLRALLNHSVREVYRRKASDQKFTNDITVEHTIAISGGTGTLPDGVMREFLRQANMRDGNSFSLISFEDYAVDATNQTFSQLGYTWLVGDTLHYTAPTPDLDDFDGSLFLTVATFPTFPSDMASDISLPSQATADDIALFLSMAILGQEGYQVVSV